MTMSRSGCGKPSGRSSVVLIRLKTTVLAPIPNASERVATAVNPGFLRSRRKPYTASWSTVIIRRLALSESNDYDTAPALSTTFPSNRCTEPTACRRALVVRHDANRRAVLVRLQVNQGFRHRNLLLFLALGFPYRRRTSKNGSAFRKLFLLCGVHSAGPDSNRKLPVSLLP